MDKTKEKFTDGFKSYTGLNRISLKIKQAHILRVWYELNIQDNEGCGWYPRIDFITIVKSLGLGQRRAEQIYDEGMDTFWKQSGDDRSIRLVSKYKLARILGVYLGDVVKLPREILRNLTKTKAHFYASFFAKDSRKPDGGNTISRKTDLPPKN